MSIKNLRITIQNERSIWHKHEKKIDSWINYKDTSVKFDVSYCRVYSWVKMYESFQTKGDDHCGRGKPAEEFIEFEKLQVGNRLIKAHTK